jgi:hypothetical protein
VIQALIAIGTSIGFVCSALVCLLLSVRLDPARLPAGPAAAATARRQPKTSG